MCGLAGFVGSGDRDLLAAMTERLVHRGPDAGGFHVDAGNAVHLGHRRLSVIDHQGGRQPMSDAAGDLTVVFNGEIYNHRELRAELERGGARFGSDHSDTEVLLHGYRQWGERLPDRLNGMWAFVLYDRPRRRLFCSRDRFGKKPLYYHHRPGLFAFASELSALRRHPDVPNAMEPRALRKYFAYGYLPAPWTLYQGVLKLPAGCSMRLDLAHDSLEVVRDWRYRPEPDPALADEAVDTLVDRLSDLLDAAVSRRLAADVPVGLFLSGGLDSSLVTAMAMRHAGSGRLKTFSIGFDEPSFDESEAAVAVARHLGAEHRIERISLMQARERLPELLQRIDEPIADSSLLPTWLLCGHARGQVTVALGGDGADELFAGYDPFRALRHARWYERWVPGPMHRALSTLAAHWPVSHRYMSFDFRLKRMLRGLGHEAPLRLPVWLAPVTPDDLADLLAEPVDLDEVYAEAIDIWTRHAELDDVERTSAFFVELYLQDDILVKLDRASMLHSLELRSPFLDIDLVDFARTLPTTLKLRGGESKWLLRRVGERLLPASTTRRRKQGFALPIGRWFADGALADDLQVPPARHPFWQRQLADHRAGRADHRLYLWAEMMLSGSAAQASAGAGDGLR